MPSILWQDRRQSEISWKLSGQAGWQSVTRHPETGLKVRMDIRACHLTSTCVPWCAHTGAHTNMAMYTQAGTQIMCVHVHIHRKKKERTNKVLAKSASAGCRTSPFFKVDPCFDFMITNADIPSSHTCIVQMAEVCLRPSQKFVRKSVLIPSYNSLNNFFLCVWNPTRQLQQQFLMYSHTELYLMDGNSPVPPTKKTLIDYLPSPPHPQCYRSYWPGRYNDPLQTI